MRIRHQSYSTLDRNAFVRSCLRVGEHLAWRPAFHDHAGVHEHQLVGDLSGEPHLVGDDDHRHAFLGKLFHHREHFADQLRVKRRGGFVEQHELGVHRQRPGDRDPLLLAAGQLRRIGVRLIRQPDLVQQILCPAPPLRPS